jgi:hypothetical protein
LIPKNHKSFLQAAIGTILAAVCVDGLLDGCLHLIEHLDRSFSAAGQLSDVAEKTKRQDACFEEVKRVGRMMCDIICSLDSFGRIETLLLGKAPIEAPVEKAKSVLGKRASVAVEGKVVEEQVSVHSAPLGKEKETKEKESDQAFLLRICAKLRDFPEKDQEVIDFYAVLDSPDYEEKVSAVPESVWLVLANIFEIFCESEDDIAQFFQRFRNKLPTWRIVGKTVKEPAKTKKKKSTKSAKQAAVRDAPKDNAAKDDAAKDDAAKAIVN